MLGRPFILSTALIVTTIASGLLPKLVRLDLTIVVVKYGGSILWALMIYWIVSTAKPRWSLSYDASATSAVALIVELFKLYHAPALDAFRLTLPRSAEFPRANLRGALRL